MNSANFFLAGLNHLSAPVSCREKTAVSAQELGETLSALRDCLGLREASILSTCGRVEIFAVAQNPGEAGQRLRDWLLDRAQVPLDPGIYVKNGPEAVRHLFRVAAGLDSWIIGESEIQGQVKKAYQAALQRGTTGRILNQIFQAALAAGKAVRAATGIQNGIHSIGGAAALLAKKIFYDMEQGQVVVFGAGDAAEAVIRHLAAKNFKRIWIANRTLQRASELAASVGGKSLTFAEGIQKLGEAEAAVFSTACPKILLDAAALKPILSRRKRPLFLIDLGLPRNIDPQCADFEGVYLYNLDNLKEIVDNSTASKAVEKDRAEVLAAIAASECVAKLEKSQAVLARREVETVR